MKKKEYDALWSFLDKKLSDAVHDRLHSRRVLAAALHIAQHHDVDMDVLIAACILHDIGRSKSGDHAEAGAKMAYKHLIKKGWPEKKAAHVRDCILTHRFRAGEKPSSLEARILFDADKLDVCGAIGIARTLQYGGAHDEPLYAVDERGRPDESEEDTFLYEYHFKLNRLQTAFFTKEAQTIAENRHLHMRAYYAALMQELKETAMLDMPESTFLED